MTSIFEAILESSQALPEVTYDGGKVILEQGQSSGNIFILLDGEVEISKGGIPITLVKEPGSILGEISALLDIPHIATVTTRKPCRFKLATQQDRFLETNTRLYYPLAVLLAQRLNSVTSYLVDIKEQFKDSSDHFGMMDEILETLVNQQAEDPQPGSDRDSEYY